MGSQFQLFQDALGEWRWRLLADNHEPIAAASEGYKAKEDAVRGIEIMRTMEGRADIYEDVSGEWRWRLTSTNGRIIATGAESYVKRADCEHGLTLTTTLAKDAPVVGV